MRYKIARRALIFWCLFIGIGAVFGSACMLIAKDGSLLSMQGMLPYFQVLPFSELLFQDYIFPGIALLVVNGLTNLTAAVLLIKKKPAAIGLGALFGFTLMLWIVIQFIIFPANFLSTAYFIFGALQLITGLMCLAFYKQETFAFDENAYPNVGKTGSELVVYFSRLGYTKKLAYELANALGADIACISTPEPTANTAGFWWCGRFAMHRWGMKLNKLSVDPQSYSKVTICSPIWVFSVCAPVRSLLERYSGRLGRVSYYLTHFQRITYKKVFDEMDAILKTKRESATSVCVRFGKQLYVREIDAQGVCVQSSENAK